MVGLSEAILSLVMLGISAFLIWTILSTRQRRMKFAAEGGDDYSGEAKEPDALSEPDSDAIDEMTDLLDKAGFSIPEDEQE